MDVDGGTEELGAVLIVEDELALARGVLDESTADPVLLNDVALRETEALPLMELALEEPVAEVVLEADDGNVDA